MVGLLDDGRELGRSAYGALTSHVEGRMAVLRPAGQSRTHATGLAEAEDVDSERATSAVSAQRRVFRPASRECLAVESRARRQQVVVERTCGLSAVAFVARGRLLDRAQH